MITQVIRLLNADDWYGVSEKVDIAKGKYKAPSNWKETKEILRRTKNGS